MPRCTRLPRAKRGSMHRVLSAFLSGQSMRQVKEQEIQGLTSQLCHCFVTEKIEDPTLSLLCLPVPKSSHQEDLTVCSVAFWPRQQGLETRYESPRTHPAPLLAQLHLSPLDSPGAGTGALCGPRRTVPGQPPAGATSARCPLTPLTTTPRHPGTKQSKLPLHLRA